MNISRVFLLVILFFFHKTRTEYVFYELFLNASDVSSRRIESCFKLNYPYVTVGTAGLETKCQYNETLSTYTRNVMVFRKNDSGFVSKHIYQCEYFFTQVNDICSSQVEILPKSAYDELKCSEISVEHSSQKTSDCREFFAARHTLSVVPYKEDIRVFEDYVMLLFFRGKENEMCLSGHISKPMYVHGSKLVKEERMRILEDMDEEFDGSVEVMFEWSKGLYLDGPRIFATLFYTRSDINYTFSSRSLVFEKGDSCEVVHMFPNSSIEEGSLEYETIPEANGDFFHVLQLRWYETSFYYEHWWNLQWEIFKDFGGNLLFLIAFASAVFVVLLSFIVFTICFLTQHCVLRRIIKIKPRPRKIKKMKEEVGEEKKFKVFMKILWRLCLSAAYLLYLKLIDIFYLIFSMSNYIQQPEQSTLYFKDMNQYNSLRFCFLIVIVLYIVIDLLLFVIIANVHLISPLRTIVCYGVYKEFILSKIVFMFPFGVFCVIGLFYSLPYHYFQISLASKENYVIGFIPIDTQFYSLALSVLLLIFKIILSLGYDGCADYLHYYKLTKLKKEERKEFPEIPFGFGVLDIFSSPDTTLANVLAGLSVLLMKKKALVDVENVNYLEIIEECEEHVSYSTYNFKHVKDFSKKEVDCLLSFFFQVDEAERASRYINETCFRPLLNFKWVVHVFCGCFVPQGTLIVAKKDEEESVELNAIDVMTSVGKLAIKEVLQVEDSSETVTVEEKEDEKKSGDESEVKDEEEGKKSDEEKEDEEEKKSDEEKDESEEEEKEEDEDKDEGEKSDEEKKDESEDDE